MEACNAVNSIQQLSTTVNYPDILFMNGELAAAIITEKNPSISIIR
jgi:hypothetical protein